MRKYEEAAPGSSCNVGVQNDIGLNLGRQKGNIVLEVFNDLLMDRGIHMKGSTVSKDVEHDGKLMKRRM